MTSVAVELEPHGLPAPRRTPPPAERPATRPAAHLPQLDSLRAFAVLAVMVHHFWPDATLGLPFGRSGVKLFFALSGFLITRILLEARQLVETGRQTPARVVRQFYIRRFLRIFPLFYATLAVAYLMEVPEVRDSLGWHVTYLTNVYYAGLHYWRASTSHLWSLAVEEQFYLVWPAVIVFTPRKYLSLMLWTVVATAPAFRLVATLAGVHWMAVYTLPFGSIDSLALGGLLAYSGATAIGRSHADSSPGVLSIAAALSAIALAVDVTLRQFEIGNDALDLARIALDDTVWAVVFRWLIAKAAHGFNGGARNLFSLGALRYTGKISYGLYVIHVFMMRGVPWAFGLIGLSFPNHPAAQFAVLTAATFALASLSWSMYERPINDLKRFVAYDA